MRIDAEQQPDLRAIHGSKMFRLLADYVYVVGKGWTITVPKGFVCDGASIPRVFWTLAGVRLGGRICAAGVVHDWIYYNNGAAVACGGHDFSRYQGDGLFRRIMDEAGMETHRMRRCYWAVYACGWRAWRKHAKRIASEKT